MAKYAVRDQGIVLHGFAQLQEALRRIEGVGDFGLAYEVQAQMRRIGEKIAKDAPGFVTHKTGRHSDPNQPRLEESVKVSTTLRSASVYSTAIYGGVQNVGGRVGHGAIVKRADVSHWMERAVATNQKYVQAEVEALLDRLLKEFHD